MAERSARSRALSSRAALLLAALAVSACRGDVTGDPPRLTSGRTACQRCGMAVDQVRFAGGWVDEEGMSVLFDDAGELLAALKADPARKAIAYAGGLDTGGWVRVTDAVFVRAPGYATPMATGVVAFSAHPAADAFLKSRSGAVVIPLP